MPQKADTAGWHLMFYLPSQENVGVDVSEVEGRLLMQPQQAP